MPRAVAQADLWVLTLVRGRETRSFEAVVCYANRGGVGSDRGVLFAFSGTSRRRMRAEGLLALKRLGYEGKGEITVISDGEDCLKRLKSALPQPATTSSTGFTLP